MEIQTGDMVSWSVVGGRWSSGGSLSSVEARERESQAGTSFCEGGAVRSSWDGRCYPLARQSRARLDGGTSARLKRSHASLAKPCIPTWRLWSAVTKRRTLAAAHTEFAGGSSGCILDGARARARARNRILEQISLCLQSVWMYLCFSVL
jgi:hypothetical protein